MPDIEEGCTGIVAIFIGLVVVGLGFTLISQKTGPGDSPLIPAGIIAVIVGIAVIVFGALISKRRL